MPSCPTKHEFVAWFINNVIMPSNVEFGSRVFQVKDDSLHFYLYDCPFCLVYHRRAGIGVYRKLLHFAQSFFSAKKLVVHLDKDYGKFIEIEPSSDESDNHWPGVELGDSFLKESVAQRLSVPSGHSACHIIPKIKGIEWVFDDVSKPR